MLHPLTASLQLRPKRRWLLLGLIYGLLLSQKVLAQEVHRMEVDKKKSEYIIIDYVEQMPEYPGGMKALLQFIAQNTRYPVGATQQGRVFVGFIVTKTGGLDSIRLLKGLEPILDAEALRVARLVPPWIPAKQNGRPVAVSFVIPVHFPADSSVFSRRKRRK